MGWRNLAECGERTLIEGATRVCVRVVNHDGLHQDLTGQPWETDLETLARLRARWGHRWHIVFTGHTWIASTYRGPIGPSGPGVPSGHSKHSGPSGRSGRSRRAARTERIETAPCPEQLEQQLRDQDPLDPRPTREALMDTRARTYGTYDTYVCRYDPLDPENAPLTEDEQASLEAQDHLMELRRRARTERTEPEA